MNTHRELEKKIGRENVLVVNSTMEVNGIVPWSRAMSLVFEEKAYPLLGRTDGAQLHSAYLTFDQPLVVALVKYAQVRDRVFDVEDNVNKTYIRQRDNYTCAYCGEFGNTVDHIMPKSRGGKDTWGNLVTACHKCNGMKRDRTPEEAGLKAPVIASGTVGNRKLSQVQSLLYEAIQAASV